MWIKGKIKSFNHTRGFGFIEAEGKIQDVFFHITDLPQQHIEPRIGEAVSFVIVEDQGKFKAGHIKRTLDTLSVIPSSRSKANKVLSSHSSGSAGFGYRAFIGIMLVLVSIALGVYGYGQYQHYRIEKQRKTAQLILEQQRIVEQQRKALGNLPDQILSAQDKRNLDSHNAPRPSSLPEQNRSNTPLAATTTQFKCDGRTHCSQMRSYEEAVYFLKNCPNTRMDGNNDGVPCERQFSR